VDAAKCGSIRVLLYTILPCNFPSELLTVIEELDEGIGCFAFLHRKRSGLGSVKQVRNIMVSTCDLSAILDPCVQTRNCHLAGPLMANDQK
jgi:hypothetical protein